MVHPTVSTSRIEFHHLREPILYVALATAVAGLDYATIGFKSPPTAGLFIFFPLRPQLASKRQRLF